MTDTPCTFRNKRMASRLLAMLALFGVLGMGWLFAQTDDERNAGSKLEYDALNEIWRFKWWGKTGRAYYIQYSEGLADWEWVPVIKAGDDSEKEWSFPHAADRLFVRLRHVPFTGDDVSQLDSFGNGLSDLWEIQNYGTPGLDSNAVAPGKGNLTYGQVHDLALDPHQSSTNNIGIPDDWLVSYDLNPHIANPDSDQDQDGLTLREEFEIGTDPTKPDTDGDGVVDGEDGWALHSAFAPARVTVPKFVTLMLSEDEGSARAVNNSGTVAYTTGSTRKIWKEGQTSIVSLSSDALGIYDIGLTDDGVAAYYYSLPSPLLDTGSRLEIAWAAHQENTTTLMPTFFSNQEITGESFVSPINGEPDFYNNDTSFYTGIDGGGGPVLNVDSSVSVWLRHGLQTNAVQEAMIQRLGFGTVDTAASPLAFPHQWTLGFADPFPEEIYEPWIGKNQHSVSAGHQYKQALSHYVAAASTSSGIIFLAGDTESYIDALSNNNHLLGFTNDQDEVRVMWVDSNAGHRLETPTGQSPQYVQVEWDGTTGDIPNWSASSVFPNNMSVLSSEHLWTNGINYSLNNLTSVGNSSFSEILGQDISRNGMMIAGSAVYAINGKRVPVLLLPFDMAVDANRDGTVKFAGNPSAAGAYDKTEETKPFRFWCNNDDDRDEEDHPGSSQKDSDDNEIQSLRDLEDFTRLHIHIGGLHDAIAIGTFQIGLEWRSATDSPVIKVYTAAENDGGDRYLRTTLGAGNQALGAAGTALGTISNGASFKLPAAFWQADLLAGRPAFSAENPNRHLIFEATGEGKGQLVMTIWKGTEKIGEGPGVWIEMTDIKKMYVRSNDNEFASSPWDETEDTIIFVHGWRMSPEGRSQSAETFYKRLWHRGFKGHYAAFQWNTYHSNNWQWLLLVGGGIDAYLSKYNDSEEIAWQSAAALKNFVNGLPGTTKHIAAHSMGNIVTSEAIHLGMNVDNYALMQAAVPSAAYDEHERTKQITTYNHFTFTMWDKDTPDDDPDQATRDLAYRGRFNGIGTNTNLVNFFLEPDYATFMPWEVNNDQGKPEHGSLAKNYRYIRNAQGAEKLYKFKWEDAMAGDVPIQVQVVDYYLTNKPYESMSHASSTWGKAVGAQNVARGSINFSASVDLSQAAFTLPGESDPGFGDEHSGQFNANIQHLKSFYDRLLDEFVIPRNP